jgi:hypothetical protein
VCRRRADRWDTTPETHGLHAAIKISTPDTQGLKLAASHHPILLTGWNIFHEATPMSEKLAHRTKNKLAKTYAIGIVVFSALFGFLTLFSIFLAHLK